jgi:hypothetical protein
MRVVPFLLAILLVSSAADAQIRQFNLKTIERLGNELTRVSQQPERGATDAVRKRAKQTAMAALSGKLFNIHYDYVVLDDPDGSGFLVYALGSKSSNEVVLAGHFRVTVSADGNQAERVDALSRSLNVVPKQGPNGQKAAELWIVQLVSNIPVETFIYLSNLHHAPIIVGTLDRKMWEVKDGRMEIIHTRPGAPGR